MFSARALLEQLDPATLDALDAAELPDERLETMIQTHVATVLRRCAGDATRAACRLGISRVVLGTILARTLRGRA